MDYVGKNKLFAGGDTNLYGYVGSDPVNWIDPSGLIFQKIISNYLSPNQQLMLGSAISLLGARIAISGGMSVNPALFAFGLALGMDGSANFNYARDRGAPEIDLYDNVFSNKLNNNINSCTRSGF